MLDNRLLILVFFIGFWLGTSLGFLIMSLMVMTKRSDDTMMEMGGKS